MNSVDNSILNDDFYIIENISNCINDKLSLLRITLPELANNAAVDYFTLKRIINHKEDYMPNLRILIKLAKYLNIKVGDLLNYNNLPQYVPVLEKFQILEFLNNKQHVFGFNNKIFIERHVHEYAFAVKELNKELLAPAEIIYVCYPNKEINLTKNKVYLFKTQDKQELIFGRVNSIDADNLLIKVGQNIISLKNYETIAIVIAMLMNETLI